MIIYANGRTIGTTPDGESSFIQATGINGDSLNVSDSTTQQYLYFILRELRITNMHLHSLSDQRIHPKDVDVDIDIDIDI